MKISRIVIVILLIFTILSTCGCNKEKEEENLDVYWKFDCNSTDERLYKTLVCQKDTATPMELGINREKEGMEKYDGIYIILTRVMRRNADDEDKEYHVLLRYWGMNDITNRPDGLMTQDIVDKINEQYNREFQLDEWVQIKNSQSYYYYYVFTADEIFDLADFGIECMYVGSGEGDIEDVNYKTPEGIATYCELHGDGGVIQYKKGQKLYY